MAGYTLIPLQALFTAEWLTAIGTVGTGVFAVYAALQSNRIARAEHERAKAQVEAAGKAFCARVAQSMWLAGNAFGEAGFACQKSGDSASAWASANTLRFAIANGVDLNLVRGSPEVIALLPSGLAIAMNTMLTEVEAFPGIVNHLLSDGDMLEYDEAGQSHGFNAAGIAETQKIGRLALGTAGRLHACLGAMERFVGWPLAPDSESRKGQL